VVVLPETDLLQAIAGAERLRSAIQSRIVAAREAGEGSQAGSEVAFTVSIGVASHPDDGVAATDLLQAADAALTEAKRTRNVVYAYRDILKGGESARKRIAVLDGFLRDSSLSTVGPLVTAIDTRDPGSVRHSEKTAEYAVAIGRELGLSTQDLAMTCKAALLHDVGMIGVPDNLLTKTSSLSDEEMAIVRRHCRLGADILSQSPHLAAVAEIVLRHHERWNGTGYPGALAGDEIPIIARVVAVADSLDAMTSSRSYKEPMSFDDALQELQAQSGKQFDPDVIEAAARVIQSLIEQQEDEKAAA
jgi:putative nucleotidyltransferase with HDIG domain